MKIKVVMFCTLPLVALHKKAPVLTSPATRKMENAFFMWKLKNH
jgi:hypothetical protein